tara:strand:+ start:3678 stop:5459 length:1782 start_codon:yes stop_codon:yes gene_type:complete
MSGETKRKRIKREFSKKELFEEALNNSSNVFMTIHGDPFPNTSSQPSTGKVPEGCILVIITPPQAVVYSSPTEDTETYRFFQQKNWIKTLHGGSSENCYGADRYLLPHEGEIGKRNEPDDDEPELDHIRIQEDPDNYIVQGPDAEVVPFKIRRANQLFLDASELTETGLASVEEEERRRRILFHQHSLNPPNTAQRGFEILNHIQIFLPGQTFYNQLLTFDQESEDFDAYCLGPLKEYYHLPHTGNQRDETIPYAVINYEGPYDEDGISQLRLRAEAKKVLTPGESSAAADHPAHIESHTAQGRLTQSKGAQRYRLFNRIHTTQQHAPHLGNIASLRTTQEVLDYIMRVSGGENQGKPKIIILNSCSPSKNRTGATRSRVPYEYKAMKENIKIRGKIYMNGRKQFCELRAKVADQRMDKTQQTKLPLYIEHYQYTRIDEEDLNSTHRFIGELFQEEVQIRSDNIAAQGYGGKVPEDPTSTPPSQQLMEIFNSLYVICVSDRRATLLPQFREKWISLFGDTTSEYGWNAMVGKWRKEMNSPLDEDEEDDVVMEEATGGRRKRRKTRKRKKRKTKRKRFKKKRKTRKKRKTKRKK